MIVAFSAASERDLEAIGDRIAIDNPERATSFVEDLIGSCLELAEFPNRFPLVLRYEAAGIRHRVHGNYLIFYRVERESVVILHVLHGAMDYAGLLSGE